MQPIADEFTADRAIELFLQGYDPLLYAADLGLTPEQVWDQIRVTLRIYMDKAIEAQRKLSRKGRGGPKRKPESELSPAAAAVRRSRDRRRTHGGR